jgi:glycosyltransferase involved in cell wall biosynthesis
MFPLKPFNRFALKNLSRAIGVSPAVCEHLVTLFPKEKVTSIPNGIEIVQSDDAARQEMRTRFREFHSIPDDAPLIGTVGQLIPLKGQRELVLAAGEIIKAVPNARFVIVGEDNSSSKNFRRELKRLADVLGVAGSVLWLDWAEDLPTLFAALDIYVSPSHSESFGIATLEAMAAGVAVVATRTDGSKELLGDPELMVPFGDPLALANRIIALIRDANLRHSITDKLQKRAAESYSLASMVERVETVYSEIIGS